MLIKTKHTANHYCLNNDYGRTRNQFCQSWPSGDTGLYRIRFPIQHKRSTPQGNTAQYLSNFSEAVCKQHAPYPGPHVAITSAAENN